mgnify:FL=1
MRILMLALFMLLNACSTVSPWEKGYLAKPQMALNPYPLQSNVQAHIYGSREAGAHINVGGGGGGCGCY